MSKTRLAIIGSGNWGSAIARIAGANILRNNTNTFEKEVRMWVFEETVKTGTHQGKKLTSVINEHHENVMYLPGFPLPENIIADPDVVSTIKGANALIFVVPHQFVHSLCKQIKDSGLLAENCRAISLIKGIDTKGGGISLLSDTIKNELHCDVSVLMGANIADEVAKEKFCETTIGYSTRAAGEMWKSVFDTPLFRVSIIDDVPGVEICGALKNVVAIAAGIIDGLKMGDNTKAAIIRIGLQEMRHFSKLLFEGIKDETFFESCGVADLITTCSGGRNRKVAEARVLTGKSFEILEKEMLGGQQLQGTGTAKDVYKILSAKNLTDKFPLFTAVHDICYNGLEPKDLISKLG